jgi:hypothetical protein
VGAVDAVILDSSRVESLKVLAISTRLRPEKKFLANECAGIAINEFLANDKGLCEAIVRGLPRVREDSGERRSGGASIKAEAGRLNQTRQK